VESWSRGTTVSDQGDQSILPASKWVPGISADDPAGEVATAILDARLKAVGYWLPLAAERSDEDIEHVHQLRIATRRAVAALRMFADLVPAPEGDEFRAKLRRIRLAADEARNWDVLGQRFLSGAAQWADPIVYQFVEQVTWRRREVQPQLVAIHRELGAEQFNRQTEQLTADVRAQHGDADRPFGQRASQDLRPVLKKFFKAAKADLSSNEALHALRIRAKKLRYAMEIVASAFAPAFRKKLYPQVSLYQDLLGAVNDHATAKVLFQEWLAKSQDALQRAFLEGVILAESSAHRDLREAFLALWTPKVVRKLRRQFRACCDVP
jgi:CHAD domain-containing protein